MKFLSFLFDTFKRIKEYKMSLRHLAVCKLVYTKTEAKTYRLGLLGWKLMATHDCGYKAHKGYLAQWGFKRLYILNRWEMLYICCEWPRA